MHRRARPAELAQVDSPLGLGVEGADVRPLYKVEGGEEEEQVVARRQFGCGVLAEPTSEGFERRPDVSFEGTRLCQQVTLDSLVRGEEAKQGAHGGVHVSLLLAVKVGRRMMGTKGVGTC